MPNDDTAFQPFQPMFEEGKPPDPPKADKSKRERKPRAANAGPKIPKPPKHKRPTRKKIAVKKHVRVVGKRSELAAPYKKTRALKMDMYAAMAISALLKPTDFKLFERLTEALQSVNKATRRRVLGAIQKVFG